ncbi:hypothetical protein [Escherichia albertii]|uniref:hypothetical protein n=1 Tax=Escherichia albertii TaxID=208962 RepID=UPI00148242E0|nr:hypothetical protein [Escherichia albertii]EHQ8141647.1 hypothetical protein [Escherichia albertii]WDB76283.1 hypothetical protein PS034_10815 [Escherichia albertii]
MEGKNGLKIVCDSRKGFSTEQAVFLANNLAKKNAIVKTKAKYTEILFCAGRTILHSL